jgi:hypothetical protein
MHLREHVVHVYPVRRVNLHDRNPAAPRGVYLNCPEHYSHGIKRCDTKRGK